MYSRTPKKMKLGSQTLSYAAVACLLTQLIGCVATGRPVFAATESSIHAQIRQMLHGQAEAWNEGNIERFMEPYSHSENLTFSSGGRVTRGWQATLDGYRTRYPSPEAMGKLSFFDLEVMRLGHQAALVLGRWHLTRDNPVGGAFSLVLRKEQRGQWVIIHDHTSTDAP